MNTLKNFIDNQAGELLQQSDLVALTGGSESTDKKDLNIFGDCGTTNNCQGGNCSTQCACDTSGTPDK